MTHGGLHMTAFDLYTKLSFYTLGLILVFILGRILHELTHYVAAWLAGAESVTGELALFSGGFVEYKLEQGHSLWKPILINASPQIIGIAIGVPYVLWLHTTGASILMYPVVGSFLTAYALLGSAGDLLPLWNRDTPHLWHPSKGEKMLVIALGLVIAAWLGNSVDAAGYYRISLAVGLTIAGLGTATLAVLEINTAQS